MTHPTLPIPASLNEDWGFFGTISHHAEPRAAWDLVLLLIAEATGCDYDEARAFLDSRHGRHFADTCSSYMTDDAAGNDAAIREAIASWMSWTVGPRTSRNTGIPSGLAWLTGYVLHAAIEAEAAE